MKCPVGPLKRVFGGFWTMTVRDMLFRVLERLDVLRAILEELPPPGPARVRALWRSRILLREVERSLGELEEMNQEDSYGMTGG